MGWPHSGLWILRDEALHSNGWPIEIQDRVASLPIGTHIYRVANNNSDDDNTVVENYYQLGKAEFRGHGKKQTSR
jgi:hypothetical protein